jgi:hypothetical protein
MSMPDYDWLELQAADHRPAYAVPAAVVAFAMLALAMLLALA